MNKPLLTKLAPKLMEYSNENVLTDYTNTCEETNKKKGILLSYTSSQSPTNRTVDNAIDGSIVDCGCYETIGSFSLEDTWFIDNVIKHELRLRFQEIFDDLIYNAILFRRMNEIALLTENDDLLNSKAQKLSWKFYTPIYWALRPKSSFLDQGFLIPRSTDNPRDNPYYNYPYSIPFDPLILASEEKFYNLLSEIVISLYFSTGTPMQNTLYSQEVSDFRDYIRRETYRFIDDTFRYRDNRPWSDLPLLIDPDNCNPSIQINDQDSLGPFDHRNTNFFGRNKVLRHINEKYFDGKLLPKGSMFGSDTEIACIYNPNLIGQILESSPDYRPRIDGEPGYTPELTWEVLRNYLISNSMPVWPTKSEECECADCPEGYVFCADSSPEESYCVPECCGGQILKQKISGCECECPKGYEWVVCYSSDCRKKIKDCQTEPGYCVKSPDRKIRERLIWDSVECKWICNPVIDINYKLSQSTIVWADSQGARIDVSPTPGAGSALYIPPCDPIVDENDQIIQQSRIPENDCDCEPVDTSSGSYWEDAGIPEVPPGYVLIDNQVLKLLD